MNKLKAIVAALLLSVGITLVAASPAHADFSWCTGNGRVCVAEHSFGNGLRASLYGPVGACLNVPWNDKISSVKNVFTSSGGIIHFWHNAGCNGVVIEFDPGETINTLSWPYNDAFSSYCIGPEGPGPNACSQYYDGHI
jgi:hypothetical protein